MDGSMSQHGGWTKKLRDDFPRPVQLTSSMFADGENIDVVLSPKNARAPAPSS